MFVKQFLTGGDRNFGYLVADEATKQALVIDPSYAPDTIVEFARGQGYEIVYVFCTHGHYDHTNGNATLQRLTGKRALLFGDVAPLEEGNSTTGVQVADGARFPLGNLEVLIIHTPGHSDDAICIYVEDAGSGDRAVFTGDTLFVGKVGGTDYGINARIEYESLHHKLLTLPDETRVFPGHNVGVAPESTIGHERTTNPFLVQPNFEAFLHLKKTWTAYKLEHGIA
ncbi:MAG: MBL fold metallo-hydrolase [Anaerolineae bacterium]|nr:MBL fold metallo-hydrolase [Anaerolineae bacterium]